MFYIYILECDKAFFYVGLTNNLTKRIVQHQSKYSPHTKRYKEVELVYCEIYSKRVDAEKREKQLKGWSRAKKKALVDNDIEKLKLFSSGD